MAGDVCASATELDTCTLQPNGCFSVTSMQTCTTNVAHASASCSNGACGFTCDAPYVLANGACVPPPPRPIFPVSGSNVSTQLPKLSWALPSGFTDAHVDVCKDRACTNVLATADVTGSSATIASALPPGLAFWRVITSDGGVPSSAPSAVWEIAIGGTHSAPSTVAWGNAPDFNGDGLADLVYADNSGNTFVVYGNAGASIASPTMIPASKMGGFAQPFLVGDFNGDGFTDLGLQTGVGMDFYYGGASGLPTSPTQSIFMFGGIMGLAVGDVDGDGYADIVFPTFMQDGMGNTFIQLNELAGSANGVSLAATTVTTMALGSAGPSGGVDTCDVNGDGYADFLLGSSKPMPNGSTSFVFYGSAAGLSATGYTTITTSGNFGFPNVACAGDVNGDGFADAVVMGSSTSAVYAGGAKGLSTTALGSVIGGSVKNGSVPSIADFDGDGYSDIVLASTAPQIKIIKGSAAGPNPVAVTINAPPPSGLTPSSSSFDSLSGAGDFDGDGLADLAFEIDWTNTQMIQSHELYLYKGTNASVTAPASTANVVANDVR